MSVEHFPGEQIHLVKELRPFFLKMRISSLNPQSDVLLPIRFFTEDGSFHTGRIYHQFIFFDGDEVQRDAAHSFHLGVNYARIRSNKRQHEPCKWEMFSVEVSVRVDHDCWAHLISLSRSDLQRKQTRLLCGRFKIQVKKQQILY